MGTLFTEHFATVEGVLIEKGKISANAGHSLHVGTPREVFISEFLRDHHARSVDFGTGEIIDHESQAKGQRNQHDIVVHYRDFPRIPFGGNTYAFLSESVVATIEVKSTLTKDEFFHSMGVARATKLLK